MEHLLMPGQEWMAQGACVNRDPDELFVEGAAQRQARAICFTCPVRTECLAEALDNRIQFGVWGGMTERERRALLKRRPDVVSWRELFERAREEFDTNDARPRTGAPMIPAGRMPGGSQAFSLN